MRKERLLGKVKAMHVQDYVATKVYTKLYIGVECCLFVKCNRYLSVFINVSGHQEILSLFFRHFAYFINQNHDINERIYDTSNPCR